MGNIIWFLAQSLTFDGSVRKLSRRLLVLALAWVCSLLTSPTTLSFMMSRQARASSLESWPSPSRNRVIINIASNVHLSCHTVILNDPLYLLHGEGPQCPLVWRPHLVREHHGGVHHHRVEQLDGPEVGLEAVADHDVPGLDLEQELGLDVPKPCGDPGQVSLLDPREPGVVVEDLVVRHHEALVLGVPGVVDQGDADQLAAHRGVDHLAVHGPHPALAPAPLVQAGHEAPHAGVVLGLCHVTRGHLNITIQNCSMRRVKIRY